MKTKQSEPERKMKDRMRRRLAELREIAKRVEEGTATPAEKRDHEERMNRARALDPNVLAD